MWTVALCVDKCNVIKFVELLFFGLCTGKESSCMKGSAGNEDNFHSRYTRWTRNARPWKKYLQRVHFLRHLLACVLVNNARKFNFLGWRRAYLECVFENENLQFFLLVKRLKCLFSMRNKWRKTNKGNKKKSLKSGVMENKMS